MDEKFSPQIEKCLQTLEDNIAMIYSPQYGEYRKYCEELFEYATEEESDVLFAYAYFYMMQFYASDNDCINTIDSGLEGIKYQLKAEKYEMAARSYNILGIYANASGNVEEAIEYYLTCVDLCVKKGLGYVRGMACCNLADLFRENHCPERALYYYDVGGEILEVEAKDVPTIISYGNLSCLYTSKGYCYLSIGRLEDALLCADKVEKLWQKLHELGENRDEFGIHTFLATIAHAKGDDEQCSEELALAQKYFHQSDNYTDYLEDILAYIDLHMETRRYVEATEILDYFINRCEKDVSSFYIKSQFFVKRIMCAKVLDDQAGYIAFADRFLEAYREYGGYGGQRVLQAESTHKEKIREKEAKEKLSTENEQLLVKSNHDTLTGLPNRAYWHSYAEPVIARAIKNKTRIGVAIMDIDFFKEVNDNYGHLEGDRYLVEVANILFQMTRRYPGLFAARYGGDEFVFLIEDKDDDTIREYMQQIEDAMHLIHLPGENPMGVDFVTISQGCCNRIPVGANRLWDFLAAADRLLYQVKEAGKDGYIVSDGRR